MREAKNEPTKRRDKTKTSIVVEYHCLRLLLLLLLAREVIALLLLLTSLLGKRRQSFNWFASLKVVYFDSCSCSSLSHVFFAYRQFGVSTRMRFETYWSHIGLSTAHGDTNWTIQGSSVSFDFFGGVCFDWSPSHCDDWRTLSAVPRKGRSGRLSR